MRKDTNPKTASAVNKLPLHLVPPTVMAHLAVAYLNGERKYTRMNWRTDGASASVYISAALRHINAWMEGENVDKEGIHHLAAAMSGLGIILDATACGVLNDDRVPHGTGYASVLAATTAQVENLNAPSDGVDDLAQKIADSVDLDNQLSELWGTRAHADTLAESYGDLEDLFYDPEDRYFKIDDIWETILGDRVLIVDISTGGVYPIKGELQGSRTRENWTAEGHLIHGQQSDNDLYRIVFRAGYKIISDTEYAEDSIKVGGTA